MKIRTLLLCLLVSTTGLFAQTTYTVDNKPGAPADFDNLQTAIHAAAPGDVLLVQGSPNNYGTVTINKKLTLIGAGYLPSSNSNTQAYPFSTHSYGIVLEAGANDTVISGFYFNIPYSSTAVIVINQCSNISISHCHFDLNTANGSDSGGVYINDSSNIIVSNSYNATVRALDNDSYNITIKNSFSRGIIGGDPSTFATIGCISPTIRGGMIAYNNIVANTSFGGGSSSDVHHNVITYNSTGTGSTDANGNKKIYCGSGECDNLYIDSNDPRHTFDGRYMLGAGSPAAGAGAGGIDCGMFGGGYRLSGIPNIPNIYEFVVPETGYTNESGIQIQVKAKSNN